MKGQTRIGDFGGLFMTLAGIPDDTSGKNLRKNGLTFERGKTILE